MKRKQILLLLALLMTVATGARAQEATTIVTQSNFYNYFDDNGELLDAVTSDELTFQGEFSNLAAGYVIISKPITITGDNAVLNNMGIVIISEDVAIDKLTLTATTSLGDLIYVGASNVDLTNLTISYSVDDESANVINVAGTEDVSITDVIIKNNTINFESQATSDEDLVTAINLDYVEDVIIDGNTITASLPALNVETYDWTYFMMGLCNVNPIRIYESNDVELTNNYIDVTNNSSAANYPTIQALYIVGSEDILVEGNEFKMVDTLTPAGTAIYLYAVECGFSEEIEFIKNNFNISTTGGKSGAGSAYALQVATSKATVIGNNITCESNGPNLGIFSPYGFGPAKDLVIKENFLNITGYATGSNGFALISGIEIQTGYATIYNNTIYVQNKGGYDDTYPVSGVSAVQYSANTLSFDIQANEIYVLDGKYAVNICYAPSEATVSENRLCAHELTDNDAVYFKSGDNNTVEINHGPLLDNADLADLTCSLTLPAPGRAEGSGDTQIDGKPGKPANLFSICLPFEPKTDDAVKYYTLGGVSGETLNFAEVANPVANTPYLMSVTGTGSFNLSGKDLEVSTVTINSTTVDGYTFNGTFTGMTNADAQGKYVLQSGNKWGKVTAENSEAYIPPFHAFIESPADGTSQLSGNIGGSNDNPTGIKYIRTQNTDGTELYYDLNGRRIEKPTTKGIYIHNGRKELFK